MVNGLDSVTVDGASISLIFFELQVKVGKTRNTLADKPTPSLTLVLLHV